MALSYGLHFLYLISADVTLKSTDGGIKEFESDLEIYQQAQGSIKSSAHALKSRQQLDVKNWMDMSNMGNNFKT